MIQNRAEAAILSIEGVCQNLYEKPLSTTRERGWSGVTMDVYGFIPKYHSHVPAHDHHLVCYCPSGSGRLVQRRGGDTHRGVISAGMSLIIPAGYESQWEGAAAPSARMRIPTALIASASEEIGMRNRTAFELRNVFETRDILIERLALTLIGEIERVPHPAQIMLVETVSTALVAHLVRSFNHHEAPASQQVPRLTARELSRLTDYIEDHLHRPIGLAELADLVNVSRFRPPPAHRSAVSAPRHPRRGQRRCRPPPHRTGADLNRDHRHASVGHSPDRWIFGSELLYQALQPAHRLHPRCICP